MLRVWRSGGKDLVSWLVRPLGFCTKTCARFWGSGFRLSVYALAEAQKAMRAEKSWAPTPRP